MRLSWLYTLTPRNLGRWARIALARRDPSGAPRVFYGHDRIAGAGEDSLHGGLVKFQRLTSTYPNTPRGFNLLYLVNSALPEDVGALRRLARARKARLVINQNGVAYPAHQPEGWKITNGLYRSLIRQADHVFYQSRFCKDTADRFLGEPPCPWEILYNSVDTKVFRPTSFLEVTPEEPVLILGGSQYQWYRLERALMTLAELAKRNRPYRLIVTGKLSWTGDPSAARRQADQLADDLGVGSQVEFTGPYAQDEAPETLSRGHILLHTKVNDPCPGLVVEAMACGLPVVHSATGGVPELVGEDAGIGVPGVRDWDKDHPPDPGDLADAVCRVADSLPAYRKAARQRAVDRFDQKAWVDRHCEVFEELLDR